MPNFSEGKRPEVMDAIQAAAESVAGALVLDRHADAVHNRMVLTIAGGPDPVAEAAFRATARAAALIDLGEHRGVHPRIGATDVVPFVPLGATSMQVCVELAVRVGRRIAAELDLPVYLYGEAAQHAAPTSAARSAARRVRAFTQLALAAMDSWRRTSGRRALARPGRRRSARGRR